MVQPFVARASSSSSSSSSGESVYPSSSSESEFEQLLADVGRHGFHISERLQVLRHKRCLVSKSLEYDCKGTNTKNRRETWTVKKGREESRQGYFEMQSIMPFERNYRVLGEFLHECLWAVTKFDVLICKGFWLEIRYRNDTKYEWTVARGGVMLLYDHLKNGTGTRSKLTQDLNFVMDEKEWREKTLAEPARKAPTTMTKAVPTLVMPVPVVVQPTNHIRTLRYQDSQATIRPSAATSSCRERGRQPERNPSLSRAYKPGSSSKSVGQFSWGKRTK